MRRVFARRRLSRPNDRWYYANAVVKNSKFGSIWKFVPSLCIACLSFQPL